MAAGDVGGAAGPIRPKASVGLVGLKSEPRTARTTVKFIDSPTLFVIPN